MTKFPSLKPRQAEKILLKNGFTIQRQSGSHRIFYHSGSQRLVVVPFHGKDIPTGTLRSIIRQSGLPEGKFLKGK